MRLARRASITIIITEDDKETTLVLPRAIDVNVDMEYSFKEYEFGSMVISSWGTLKGINFSMGVLRDDNYEHGRMTVKRLTEAD